MTSLPIPIATGRLGADPRLARSTAGPTPTSPAPGSFRRPRGFGGIRERTPPQPFQASFDHDGQRTILRFLGARARTERIPSVDLLRGRPAVDLRGPATRALEGILPARRLKFRTRTRGGGRRSRDLSGRTDGGPESIPAIRLQATVPRSLRGHSGFVLGGFRPFSAIRTLPRIETFGSVGAATAFAVPIPSTGLSLGRDLLASSGSTVSLPPAIALPKTP